MPTKFSNTLILHNKQYWFQCSRGWDCILHLDNEIQNIKCIIVNYNANTIVALDHCKKYLEDTFGFKSIRHTNNNTELIFGDQSESFYLKLFLENRELIL